MHRATAKNPAVASSKRQLPELSAKQEAMQDACIHPRNSLKTCPVAAAQHCRMAGDVNAMQSQGK
jgi:hypothetical protein